MSDGAAAETAMPLRISTVFRTASGWTIGRNDTLKGCLAATSYRDGTTVWFGLDAEKVGFVAFTNENWRSIENARDYRINLRAGRNRWSGNFTGIERSKEKGVITYGVKARFLIDLARAGALGIYLDGATVAQLSLSGSAAALEGVIDCARDMGIGVGSENDGDHAAQAPKGASKSGETSSSGTGFFVSASGGVLTNFHVVRGCSTVWVTQSNAARQPASVVAKDETNDLALLATGLKPTLVPALNTRPRVGENIFVYGFPLSSILATTGNFTQGIVTATAGLNDDTRMLQISAPVQPGNSGGPVIDAAGNVEGVLVSKLNALRIAKITDDIPQNVNFAIKSSIAVNFLESNSVSTNPTLSTRIYDGPALAELARVFTVKVNCN